LLFPHFFELEQNFYSKRDATRSGVGLIIRLHHHVRKLLQLRVISVGRV
jgi:hypothetical protein